MGRKIKYINEIKCAKCEIVIARVINEEYQIVIKPFQTICTRCVKGIDDKMEEDNNNKILEKIFELYDEKHFNYNTFKKIREIIKNNSPQDERFTKRSDKCIPKQEGNTLGSVDIYNKALSEKIIEFEDTERYYLEVKDVKQAMDKLIRDFCLCRDDYACWNCKNIKEIIGEL